MPASILFSRFRRTLGPLLGLFLLWPPPLRADTFLQLPLRVNVLAGEGLTDADIRARVTGMNGVLAQCGNISVTLTHIERDWPDPQHPRGGDAQGDVRLDERCQLANQGERELNRTHSGSKMFVAHEVRRDDGTAMATTNGLTKTGRPVSVIADGRGDNRTWAHEFAHQMGLGHNAIAGNLMEDPRPAMGAGTNLTQAQCDDIIRGFLRRGPIIERTIEQEFGLRRDTWVVTVFDDDDPSPVSPPYLDIVSVAHFFDFQQTSPTSTSMNASIEIEVAGLLPDLVSPSDGILYLLDLDTSGDLISDYRVQISAAGFDASALNPENRFSPIQATLLQLPGETPIASLPAVVERVFEVCHCSEPLPGTAVHDVLSAKLDLSLIDTVPPLVTESACSRDAKTGGCADILIEQAVSWAKPSTPRVQLNPRAVCPGQPFMTEGTGYTPGSEATIAVDHVVLGTAPVDGFGAFTTSLPTPSLPVGDYFIDAIDTEGQVGGAILKVGPAEVSPPLTSSLFTVQVVQNAVGLIWPPTEGGVSYRVVSGELEALRLSGGVTPTTAAPVACGVLGTEFIMPMPSGSVFLLVGAEGCGEVGSLGRASNGQPRSASAGCPAP